MPNKLSFTTFLCIICQVVSQSAPSTPGLPGLPLPSGDGFVIPWNQETRFHLCGSRFNYMNDDQVSNLQSSIDCGHSEGQNDQFHCNTNNNRFAWHPGNPDDCAGGTKKKNPLHSFIFIR